jgi:hypothetical protein
MFPCPNPPTEHPVCNFDDSYGGHYWGSFLPTIAGEIEISVYLMDSDAVRRLQSASASVTASASVAADDVSMHRRLQSSELSNSPFSATILPSASKSENTDLTGALYDSTAGVTSTVYLQLRDYFSNKLISGGTNVELALIGVGLDWGTPQPLDLNQGLQDTHYYRGFYANNANTDADTDVDNAHYAYNADTYASSYYGLPTDHLDGTYSISYTVPKSGQYVLRVAVAESGLNATYFNSTDFGHLSTQVSCMCMCMCNPNPITP